MTTETQLIGTEKQVAWAADIRAEAISIAEKSLAEETDLAKQYGEAPRFDQSDMDRLLRQERAEFWIDHAQSANCGSHLLLMMRDGIGLVDPRKRRRIKAALGNGKNLDDLRGYSLND